MLRARGVDVSLAAIAEALQLPSGCRITWIGTGENPWIAKLRIESDEFPEVQPNELIPRFNPILTRIEGAAPKLQFDWGNPIP